MLNGGTSGLSGDEMKFVALFWLETDLTSLLEVLLESGARQNAEEPTVVVAEFDEWCSVVTGFKMRSALAGILGLLEIPGVSLVVSGRSDSNFLAVADLLPRRDGGRVTYSPARHFHNQEPVVPPVSEWPSTHPRLPVVSEYFDSASECISAFASSYGFDRQLLGPVATAHEYAHELDRPHRSLEWLTDQIDLIGNRGF